MRCSRVRAAARISSMPRDPEGGAVDVQADRGLATGVGDLVLVQMNDQEAKAPRDQLLPVCSPRHRPVRAVVDERQGRLIAQDTLVSHWSRLCLKRTELLSGWGERRAPGRAPVVVSLPRLWVWPAADFRWTAASTSHRGTPRMGHIRRRGLRCFPVRSRQQEHGMSIETSPPQAGKRSGSRPGLRRAGWLLLTFNAVGLALASARYFSVNPAVFLPAQVPVYLAHLGPLLLHIGGGVVALALGPWLFRTNLRSRHPAV